MSPDRKPISQYREIGFLIFLIRVGDNPNFLIRVGDNPDLPIGVDNNDFGDTPDQRSDFGDGPDQESDFPHIGKLGTQFWQYSLSFLIGSPILVIIPTSV